MRAIVKKLFPDLDRDDIDWSQESVSFEFLAIACLANSAVASGWKASCATLPPKIRMDSWCKFPSHSFGRFGRRTRHCKTEELAGVLMPRLVLYGPSDQTFSIYYQGFPPKDVSGERPDWILVPARARVSWEKDNVSLELEGTDGEWKGIFETVLGPYGPLKRYESGTLPLPSAIVEVSLSKGKRHLNMQISRYRKTYGPIKYAGFLACRIKGVQFPVVTVSRDLESELAFKECIRAGEEIFDLVIR